MVQAEITMIPQTWVELTDEQNIKDVTRYLTYLMRMMMYKRCIITDE